HLHPLLCLLSLLASLYCSSYLHLSVSPPLPFFFFQCSGHHRDLHSFPTRRSSDLDRCRKTPAPHPPGAEKCSTSSCPAEFECDLIRERRHAGLEAAWARGRTGSRPPLLSGDKLRTARENPRADQLLPLNPCGCV